MTSLDANPQALYTLPESKIDHQHKVFAEQNLFLNQREEFLIEHVKNAISLAEKHISDLNPEILALDGMSSTKVRCFLNNIVKLPKATYLEIGCYKGATFLSALDHNQESLYAATTVDNWSEFGGSIQDFQDNCNTFIADAPFQFFSHDCFAVNPKNFISSPINIYFYDGKQSFEAQEKAYTFYDSVLDDVFISIVDDWNWDFVRAGAFSAFLKLNYEILYEVYLPARHNCDRENWWNGTYVAVIRRPT